MQGTHGLSFASLGLKLTSGSRDALLSHILLRQRAVSHKARVYVGVFFYACQLALGQKDTTNFLSNDYPLL